MKALPESSLVLSGHHCSEHLGFFFGPGFRVPQDMCNSLFYNTLWYVLALGFYLKRRKKRRRSTRKRRRRMRQWRQQLWQESWSEGDREARAAPPRGAGSGSRLLQVSVTPPGPCRDGSEVEWAQAIYWLRPDYSSALALWGLVGADTICYGLDLEGPSKSYVERMIPNAVRLRDGF